MGGKFRAVVYMYLQYVVVTLGNSMLPHVLHDDIASPQLVEGHHCGMENGNVTDMQKPIAIYHRARNIWLFDRAPNLPIFSFTLVVLRSIV